MTSQLPVVHELRPKKLSVSVVVPPAPVKVPCQRPLAPSVTSVTSVTNDKGDNEMIPGGCAQISWHLPYSQGKPQLGDRLMKRLCDQSSPQMGSLSSK